MARLPYLRYRDAPPGVREVLDQYPEPIRHRNIFGILSHAHDVFGPMLAYGRALTTKSQLDARLRELAVLRVAQLTPGATYIWREHVPVALALGVDQDQIDALTATGDKATPDKHVLDSESSLVIRFTDQLIRDAAPDEGTWGEMVERFPPREILELIMVVGHFMTFARIHSTLRIDLEDDAARPAVDPAFFRSSAPRDQEKAQDAAESSD